MKTSKEPRRLTGDTGILFESAFSGIIIRLKEDGESVIIQDFRPMDDTTVYSNPLVREITYDEDGTAGFQYADHFYHLADFMKESF